MNAVAKQIGHTPTPWTVGEYRRGGTLVRPGTQTRKGQRVSADLTHADAAHIVKCVNSYETLISGFERAQAEAHKLRFERDELVYALTLLVNGDGMCAQDSPLYLANMDVARAALAKVAA